MTTVSEINALRELAREVRAACSDSYPAYDMPSMRRIRRADAVLNGTLEKFNEMERREAQLRADDLDRKAARIAHERSELEKQFFAANTLAEAHAAGATEETTES